MSDLRADAAHTRRLREFQQQQSTATRKQHNDRGARLNRGLLKWRIAAVSVAGGKGRRSQFRSCDIFLAIRRKKFQANLNYSPGNLRRFQWLTPEILYLVVAPTINGNAARLPELNQDLTKT